MTFYKIDIKLFVLLTTAFIVMTVVGTISHELGHYSVARLLGYEATINYKSSTHWNQEENSFLSITYEQYSHEIRNDLDFPEKEKYLKSIEKYQADNFWITLGGPLQTMLTGTIGLVMLILYKEKIFISDKVTVIGWGLIFLTLFWLRQLANLFMALLNFIIKDQPSLTGDEMNLAFYLDINIWTIQIITAIAGLGTLLFVLKLLPRKVFLTFMLSGLAGGTLGYYLWLIKFGHLILP